MGQDGGHQLHPVVPLLDGLEQDKRYRSFAEEAVQKLVQERFPRPDGLDVYELLPLLVDLGLNRMNSLEGGVARPPC